jgi:hypothetical protein
MADLSEEKRLQGFDRRVQERRQASDPSKSPTGLDRRSGLDRRNALRRTSDQGRTDLWRGEEMEPPAQGILARPVAERRRGTRTRLTQQLALDFIPGGRGLLVDISPLGMLAVHPFILRPGQSCLVRLAAEGQHCTVQAVARRSVMVRSKEFPGLTDSAPGGLIYQTGLEVISPPSAFTSIYTLLTTGRTAAPADPTGTDQDPTATG